MQLNSGIIDLPVFVNPEMIVRQEETRYLIQNSEQPYKSSSQSTSEDSNYLASIFNVVQA